MDYEKEYKKLKGDIKKAYLFAQTDSTKAVLEDILPELKESEDEKWIPKEIAKYLKEKGDFRSCWIAWLERQGEKDSQVILPMFTFDDILALQCCMKKVQKDEELYNQLQTLHDRLHDAYWLEKQYEQKETLCDKCRREQPSHSCQDITELGRCALEHQSKQKTTDKVEPKFKVGDWVIYMGTTAKILDLQKHYYVGTDTNDKDFVVHYCNEYGMKKWTIKDAKAGDVLYCKNCGIEYIVMSKGVNENGNIDSYFRYNSVNGFDIDVPSVLSVKDDIITPATKEQRDLLFQKMKEAGYEWDAEKKELKKIEQKPTDNLKWGELTWKDISTLEGIINNVHYEFRNGIGEEGFGKEVLERFREIKRDEYMDSCEQRPTWSEEDEWKFSDILALLRGGENYHYNTPELFAWLKSIKDRVQPQPKQEWSEEDGSHICQIIDWLSICKTYNPDLKSVCDISMQIDWLKSLKPKSHWKPSEEQMQILHKFSVPHAVVSEEDAKNLERIYADLKQL